MYYLTENAFHPLLFGLMVTFVSGAFWFMLQKRMLLIVAIVALICTITVVTVEQMVVTDREQLVIEVNGIKDAIMANDLDAVLQFISPSNDQLMAEVKGQMPRIKFKTVTIFNLSEPIVNLESTPERAKLSFTSRVSADGSRSRFGASGSGVVRVNLDYVKSPEGRWKIIGYNYGRVKANDFFGGG